MHMSCEMSKRLLHHAGIVSYPLQAEADDAGYIPFVQSLASCKKLNVVIVDIRKSQLLRYSTWFTC